MLDAKLVQEEIDSIQNQYRQGLVSLWEKLTKMIGAADAHIAADTKLWEASRDKSVNQLEQAKDHYEHIRRIDKFADKLNLYI